MATSYKPPQLPMYGGHSGPKQFLMSYEATISSYCGNTTIMEKSFVMAVWSVAQTWYSSLQPGTITSWQKLKDMLVTSFQGFQTKPVTAQALFQCCRRFETGGSLGRRVNVAACPSPDGSSTRASAKGGSEAAGDRRERGGNPAAFVFVSRPGRVRLQ